MQKVRAASLVGAVILLGLAGLAGAPAAQAVPNPASEASYAVDADRIVVNPAGTVALGISAGNGTLESPGSLVRIDLSTDVVTAITVGVHPTAIALDPTATHAYVSTMGADGATSTLTVVNIADNSTTSMAAGSGITDVVIDHAGTYAYLQNSDNTVDRLTLTTMTLSPAYLTSACGHLLITTDDLTMYSTGECASPDFDGRFDLTDGSRTPFRMRANGWWGSSVLAAPSSTTLSADDAAILGSYNGWQWIVPVWGLNLADSGPTPGINVSPQFQTFTHQWINVGTYSYIAENNRVRVIAPDGHKYLVVDGVPDPMSIAVPDDRSFVLVALPNSHEIARVPMAAPLTPPTPTAVAGDSQAVITVALPQQGARGGGLVVTASPDGAQCQISGASGSCTITGLTNGTAYTFSAVAENVLGASPSSLVSDPVTPAATPSSPLGVTAEARDGSALIRWSTPESNGGVAITSYEVTTVGGAQTCTMEAPVDNCLVSGLVNGTSYTFTVAARNAAGLGTPSDATTPITPFGPAGAPLNVTAKAGNAVMTVKWAAPASDGGSPVLAYLVRARTSAHSQWQTHSVPLDPRSKTFGDLINGTTYSAQVAAVTIFGPGAWSSVVTGTPLTVAGPVRMLSAASGGAGKAHITWTAPASTGGGAMTGYRVWTQKASGTWTLVTPDVRKRDVVLTLRSGDYSFRVAAVTSVGVGAFAITARKLHIS